MDLAQGGTGRARAQPVVIVGSTPPNTNETIRQLALMVGAGLLVHWLVTKPKRGGR